ncbi:unannotated protein [freshwater metagenome]|uniref:Unannotated protein n=1 Tax=freshwater metagenome TaxID=449393 RepID=A0A6J7JB98_9ZZZZ
MSLVGRGQHLGLVDVVDAERLKDLRFSEVTDAGLRHDRDRRDRLDALDHLGIAHTSHAAVATDVGRNALKCHDGNGAGIFGDTSLLGVNDVHDDATLEHVGESALHELRTCFPHGLRMDDVLGLRCLFRCGLGDRGLFDCHLRLLGGILPPLYGPVRWESQVGANTS